MNQEKEFQSNTMKELPQSEQPYEKCEKYGPQTLSDAELLAVVIRTGSRGERAIDLARKILYSLPEKSLSGLFHVSLEELCQIKGIGRVKGIQLLCLTEITKRTLCSYSQKTEILCREPDVVATYFMPQMRFLETEQVRLLMLNGKYAMAKEIILSNGGFNSTSVSPREVFHYALRHQAVAILLLHNHPSGDPSPSKADLVQTRRVYETGKMVGIPLVDHIIIGDNRYFSMRDNGYLPKDDEPEPDNKKRKGGRKSNKGK